MPASDSDVRLFSSKNIGRRHLRLRQPPRPTVITVSIDAYVGHSLIFKLNRFDYLKMLVLGDRIGSNPVEFFPSLDGKPRLVCYHARRFYGWNLEVYKCMLMRFQIFLP